MEKTISGDKHNKDENDIKKLITICQDLVHNIQNNLNNIKEDIISLQDIKKQITSWKLRGLQIDTILLDKQINYFINKKKEFEDIIEKDLKELSLFNHKIKSEEENIKKSDNIYEFYKDTLTYLHKDIKTLDNVILDLSTFKELGIRLGNAFETINEQRDDICNKIKSTQYKLMNYELKTKEIMKIIDIENL